MGQISVETQLKRTVGDVMGKNWNSTLSDGKVGRMMTRTVRQVLSTLAHETKNIWDDHLPYVMCRNTKAAMLNRETNLSIDFMRDS